MRAPEDPYPDVLRDVMLARINGEILTPVMRLLARLYPQHQVRSAGN
jgi:hypothetical protein